MPLCNRNTVFVGDIPIRTSERDLEVLFSPYGFITKVKIKHGVQSGRHLAYGFVSYATEAEAQAALVHMEGAGFCGRRLRYVRLVFSSYIRVFFSALRWV
jgi:RNA recognition motif-containing protein